MATPHERRHWRRRLASPAVATTGSKSATAVANRMILDVVTVSLGAAQGRCDVKANILQLLPARQRPTAHWRRWAYSRRQSVDRLIPSSAAASPRRPRGLASALMIRYRSASASDCVDIPDIGSPRGSGGGAFTSRGGAPPPTT